MNRTALVRAVLLALSLLAWLLAAANRQERRPLDRPLLAAAGAANRKPFLLFLRRGKLADRTASAHKLHG